MEEIKCRIWHLAGCKKELILKKMNNESKTEYLKSKGWFTMWSPNNWLHAEIMDDLTLDSGGVGLDTAYKIQKKRKK